MSGSQRSYRRQRRLYIFAGLVLAVAIINLLFFLIMYRPARSEYFQLQSSIESLRTEIASRQIRVARLERTGKQLESSDLDRKVLVTKHFIPLNVGFAQVLPDLEHFGQRAGVKQARRDYTGPDPLHYGLYSIKIRIPVQGSYANIVNFIRELENSPTFYIIDSIEVHGGGEGAAGAGTLNLSLSLETFLYQ